MLRNKARNHIVGIQVILRRMNQQKGSNLKLTQNTNQGPSALEFDVIPLHHLLVYTLFTFTISLLYSNIFTYLRMYLIWNNIQIFICTLGKFGKG